MAFPWLKSGFPASTIAPHATCCWQCRGRISVGRGMLWLVLCLIAQVSTPAFCQNSSRMVHQDGALAGLASSSAGAANSRISSKLPLIDPGIRVQDSDAARWNKVILLAKPRLASGEMEMIPNTIKDMVGTFMLTMMATIEPYRAAATDEVSYRLKEVGVGFSVDLNGQPTIIDSDTQKKLGANLGFIERRMLQSSEEQLSKPRLVAKTSTLVVFDVPAIMWQGEEHRDFLMRHFIWVDARTGKCATLVWLLSEANDGSLQVVPEPMRWVPAGTREDRKIHVDSSQFVFGVIPPESAFALEDLPPGPQVPWVEPAAELAARQSYDLDSIRELTMALNQSLQSLRSQSGER